MTIAQRLDSIREAIENQRVSFMELVELEMLGGQGHIDKDDTLLRQWAGLPEEEK